MSRESRRDRLVRGMYDGVLDHLTELKTLSLSQATKESDVERWVQSVLRILGFTATDGYSIRAQEGRGNLRPDLVVYKEDKPIAVVEVKKLGFDLNRSNFRSGKVQLHEYLASIGGVRWGILCSGYEWRLFDFSDASRGVEILDFDLRVEMDDGSEIIETSKRAIDEACYSLVDLHERSYSAGEWEEWAKEATAFSPDSLVRSILSLDVMKLVARNIRGEHDYKVNIEILVDKVFELLENGLDDALPGWNDTKRAEFLKFMKTQKRASRRKRRADNKGDVSLSLAPMGSEPARDGTSSSAVQVIAEVSCKMQEPMQNLSPASGELKPAK